MYRLLVSAVVLLIINCYFILLHLGLWLSEKLRKEHQNQSFFNGNRSILASLILLPGVFLSIDQIRLSFFVLSYKAEDFEQINVRKLANSNLLKSFAVVYIVFGTTLLGAGAL